MSRPTTRGAAITAYCRECIHDPMAAGNWREQVTLCQITECPLWGFRPVTRNAPAWVRDPDNLPDGWRHLHHDEAYAVLRASIAASGCGASVQAPHGTPEGVPATWVAVDGDRCRNDAVSGGGL